MAGLFDLKLGADVGDCYPKMNPASWLIWKENKNKLLNDRNIHGELSRKKQIFLPNTINNIFLNLFLKVFGTKSWHLKVKSTN